MAGNSVGSKRKRSTREVGSSSRAAVKKDYEYVDLGDCDQVCTKCGASFWYAERLQSSKVNEPPLYSTCCKSGEVRIPYPVDPPNDFRDLFRNRDFLANIRRYNSMFAMTSFGAAVDDEINDGVGPYVFKVCGQVSHVLGSLAPPGEETPKFLQLYVYDTENEVANRLSHFSTSARRKLNPNVVSALIHILDRCNSLVKLFRTARDICAVNAVPEFSVRLHTKGGSHAYAPPSDGTLGAIIYDVEPDAKDFDIIIRTKEDVRQRINILHPLFMSLQYPLLFPLGQRGWDSSMILIEDPEKKKKRVNSGRAVNKGKGKEDRRLTMNMYYSYQIHDRPGKYTLVLQGGRLFQQYLVDAFVAVERNRLDYVEDHQESLRSEFISGVYDAVARGDSEGRNIGKRIILPSSFTGSPRYMYKHYQDALAICRIHGKPQYFITFTCNVNWPEIRRHMEQTPHLTPQDRPDIIARVFKMKVESFITFLKEEKPFGEVAADLYTIEFQKRGLPHCHTLLWVTEPYKIKEADDIDKYISAEFPDKEKDPVLFDIVSDTMVHNPCGFMFPQATCMKGGNCSKKFPKDYESHTRIDDNGRPFYRRRANGVTVNKKGFQVDCGFIVPYNRDLCLRFCAHINVEYCGWSMVIKYLFKYISKGVDRVRYSVTRTLTDANVHQEGTEVNAPAVLPSERPAVNEISNYVDGRFVCPHEAAWRILNFPIHHRDPAVQALAVHLDGYQTVTFHDNSNLESVLRNPASKKTTLTEWLANNRSDTSGRHLSYVDYLSEYRWEASHRFWTRRTSRKRPSIGRLIYIHPSSGELFYLRMLLNHQVGCTSFADIRTVGDIRYPTYRSACEKLGLIGDDIEWNTAFEEAAIWATPSELRALFAHMLLFCEIANPLEFWNEQWSRMSDDVLLDITNQSDVQGSCVPPDHVKQLILYDIERTLNTSASYSTLSNYGLPLPKGELLQMIRNRLMMEEKCYDREKLTLEHQQLKGLMNGDQRKIYEAVMGAHDAGSQILLFIYGHGGTGKTFLWKTIISGLRSSGNIVLAVAASGIAALLLPAGRTAHSRFRIPINLTEESVCNFKKNSPLAQLIRETSLIIWDEAPMSNRKCFDCVDRTLRDILDNKSLPFGGKSVLLGGDFRQTLPILQRSTKCKVISSCLTKSKLWGEFRMMYLTENMRLQNPNVTEAEKDAIHHFSEWLIDVGDGKIGDPAMNSEGEYKDIEIPKKFLIDGDDSDSLMRLISFIYDEHTLRHPTAENLCNKVIVCPKNETAHEINKTVLQLAPGAPSCYLSTDSAMPRGHDGGDTDMLYPLEYLNGLTFSGIPAHQLQLKKNVPVILMRNINQSKGLCNGTRLIITQLMERVIEAVIITGVSTGTRVYLPRICFVHDDNELPFIFRRRQFPIRLCYAMTINKSQGQSLERIGIYLPQPVFGHGQLYVALSRATSPDSLKILIKDVENQKTNITRNVVYTDFLGDIEKKKV